MKTTIAYALGMVSLLICSETSQAQWVAYNDHSPTNNASLTHSNATTWNIRGFPPGASGLLKDIVTGTNLPVTLTFITNGAVTYGAGSMEPNAGTPLYATFHGYVYFGNTTDNMAQIPSGASVTCVFTNLDPNKRYSFRGGVVRGNNYLDRWAKAAIVDAVSYTSAHTTGALTSAQFPLDIAINEAAINTGENRAGEMWDWEDINPGPDASFSVVCTQYHGAIPGGGSTAGAYGHAINGIRLEEKADVGPVEILVPPADQVVVVGDPLNISVSIGGSPPYFFQWFKDDLPISEATNENYSVSSAGPTDGGNYYIVVSNSFRAATSSVARITITNSIVITSQPQSQTVPLRQNAVFTVVVTNTAQPQYQWYSNNVAVLNATNASFSLFVTPINQGNTFYVVISNSVISVTSSVATLSITTNSQVLFIVRTNLSPADVVISNLLAAQNLLVMVQDDRSCFATQAVSKSLVVISSSVDPAQVSTKFFSATNPVIVWESGVYNYMMMTINSANQGTITNQQGLSIYDPLHPLAAGLSGNNQVFTQNQTFDYGVPGGNAIVAATAASGADLTVIFAYEKGAILAYNIPGLTAYARRVGFFLHDNGATNLTSVGSNLFNAAVQWAVGTPDTNSPVGISRHPLDIVVKEGSPATFSINATGAPPYYFQWQRNGTNITGAKDRSYTTAPTTVAENGAVFSVLATNKLGGGTSIISSNAVLTVLPPEPIVITCEPQGVVVNAGQSVSFTFCVTGGGPFVQWYKDGSSLLNATNPTLMIASVTTADSGRYYAIITNRVSAVMTRAAVLYILPPPQPLVTESNVWRFNTNATDIPGWTNVAFYDSTWPAGPGVLAAPAGEPMPAGSMVRTVLPLTLPNSSNDIITIYFRTHFNFTNDPACIWIVSSNLIDDGAVFYLNGQEIWRTNMPNGTITYSTWASAAGEVSMDGWRFFSFSPYLLQYGDNVLAVEVHQVNNTSSDIVFGEKLSIINLIPTTLAITNQPESSIIEEMKSATLSVGVSGVGARFQWYKDGQLVPGAIKPYLTISNASWNDSGAYFVTVSNALSYVVSRNAYLTVMPDTNPPVLLDADGTVSSTNILLSFSEPISALTATNIGNYVISNLMAGTRLSIYKIVLTSPTNVLLTTERRINGNNYLVMASGLQDLVPEPNTMPASGAVPLATWQTLVNAFSYYDFYNPFPPFDDPDIGDTWRCALDYSFPYWGNNEAEPGAFWCGTDFLPVSKGKEISPSPAVVNYFRTLFPFTGSPVGAKLQLRHVVDSGAVFYLNCQEILRFNMPAGPIDYATTTLSDITNASWSGWIDLPIELLRPQDNVLALELHSAKSYEPTLALAVELQARIQSLASGPVIIMRQPENQTVVEGQNVTFSFAAAGPKYFQWCGYSATCNLPRQLPDETNSTVTIPPVSPCLNGSLFWVIASNDISSATSQAAVLTVIPDTTPPALISAIALSSNTVLASFSEPLNSVTATDIANYTLTNAAGLNINVLSAALTNGTNVLLILEPGLSPSVLLVNNLRDNATVQNRIAPNSAATIGTQIQIPIDAVWKNDQSGANLGTDWSAWGYDDSTWPNGAALFFNESSALPAAKNTPLSLTGTNGASICTYYFRLRFTWPVANTSAGVLLRHVIDDGAIFYLNGAEFHRFNMPSGAVNFQTPASNTVDNAVFNGPYGITFTNLLAGDNVIAVEVHQVSSTSADVVFGTELAISVPSVALPGTNYPPSSPELRTWRIGGRTFLWWTASGFVLERADFLASPLSATAWMPVDVFTAPTNYYLIPLANSNAFYRLRY